MWSRLACAALIAAGLCGSAFAQDSSGFGVIPGVPSQANVEVDLNGAMLAFVTEAARASGSDSGAAATLAGLKGVHVRVYEKLTDPRAVAAFVDKTSRALDRAGWQRAVYVADDKDKVRIYAKTHDQQIVGMKVMVVDDQEAVFINIDGSIDPAQLGHLARVMGAGDVLGGFGETKESKKRRRERHDAQQ